MPHAIEYSVGRYRIRINIWFLIIFLLVQTLLNELGFWQLERAKEKQLRIVQLAKGSDSVVTDISQISAEKVEQFQTVELALEPLKSVVLLLDNKINNKRPGYHVINIAKEVHSGKYLLVNRGWLFAGLDRNQFPEIEMPAQNWQVKARVYPIVDAAISTTSAEIEFSGDRLRLPVLDQKIKTELEAKLKLPLESYLLRLTPESEGALKIDWVWTNMSPEKHLGYAFQWFALAFTFLIISVFVSIKKR